MGHGRMGRRCCPGEESRGDCSRPPLNTEVREPVIRILGIVMSVLDSKQEPKSK